MLKINKKFLVLILTFVVICSALITYYFLSKKVSLSIGSLDLQKTDLPTPTGEIHELKTLSGKTHNILLLGYGGAGHDGGFLSDVIMVVNIDPEYKEATFISVPRDLWVEIPIRSDISKSFKINAAYAIGNDDRNYPLKEPQYKGEKGAAHMVKKVVSDATGLTIDNYVSIDFDRFKKIVDVLGGISVDVPVAFDDYLYPVKGLENETCNFSPEKIAELHQKYSGFDLESKFTCRFEHLHFDKGLTQMNGDLALKFVRSRHSAQHGGDFARSQRQRAVILAAKDKLLSLQGVRSVDDLYKEFSQLIKSDLDLSSTKRLIEVLGNTSEYKLDFVSLNDENVLMSTKSIDGQFILIPKKGEGVWTEVHKFIHDQINLY